GLLRSPRRWPPPPPLLPCTTLFRSRSAYRNGQALAVADHDDVNVRPVLTPARWAAAESLAADVGSRMTGHAPRVLRAVPDAYQQDRKSTRLNSSHVSTSYAVLRLKK